MKRINIYKAIIAWILPFLLFAGCDGRIGGGSDVEVDREQLSLELNLNAPGIISSVTTRSMPNEAALSNVQVLVFEELSGGSEVFRYKAPIAKEAGMTYTIEAKISQNDEKYRLVVLANAPVVTLSDKDIGKSKEEILNRFTFDCAGIWNATAGNSKPFPMWGEAINTLTVKKEETVNVLLHRALAKVDVGLRFKPQTQENQTEEVEGIDNFKLTSVRVYRTVNKAYVASSTDKFNDKNEAIKPNIHPEAIYNLGEGNPSADIKDANEKPLVYEFTPADKYVREIYIPESLEVLNGTHTMDDVPCLVVGGCYGTVSKENETFYRVDFAEYEPHGVIKKGTYKSLLRNHRYVVNIKSVSGPGFKEPEMALNSISAKLQIEVKEWNERPLNFFVVGDYYFKIKSREVVLPAALFDEEGELLVDEFPEIMIPIETNIPIELSYEDLIEILEHGGEHKSLKWKWDSADEKDEFYKMSSIFAPHAIAYLSDDKKNIVIKVSQNTDESGAENPYEERTDDLIVFIDDFFQFTIKVIQEANLKPSYTLDCSTVKLNGIYKKGNSLSSNNYVEVVASIDESQEITTLEGASYVIETDKLNGISFRAQGKFGPKGTSIDGDGKSYLIRLEGTGTIEDYATNNHTITCNSTSTGNTTCSVKVATAYKPIRVLALSDNSNYGYGLNPSGYANSYNFVTSAANFGLNQNSTVKVESISITHTTSSSYFQGQLKSNPDIILCAIPASSINKVSKAELRAYLDRGGVFICLHESDSWSFRDFIRMLPGQGSANITTGPKNEAVKILKTVDDMITNGSFGDLKEKYWGATGTNKMVGNLAASKVTVYSGTFGWSDNATSTLFKHNELNFLYCGDGGLLTNDAYLGYGSFPFSVNRNTGYTPMTATYGGQTVYSAALFGNIMEWAMYQATYHGINK